MQVVDMSFNFFATRSLGRSRDLGANLTDCPRKELLLSWSRISPPLASPLTPATDEYKIIYCKTQTEDTRILHDALGLLFTILLLIFVSVFLCSR